LYERLEEAATAASDAVDNFAERLETFDPKEMKLAGAFITIDTDGELVIERGLVKREDAAKLPSNADTDASIGTASTVADEKKAKPLHGEKLCRRLTAHRTAAVQAELARRPVVALAALMNRLVPTVFEEHYLSSYAESAVKINAHTSRDTLVREADDIESSVTFTQIEADRLKWAKLLPKSV
jgi:ParB family transcriptional regulator, chromosome partitioning protein